MRFRMQTGWVPKLWTAFACVWIAMKAFALRHDLAIHRTSGVTLDIMFIVLYALVGVVWGGVYLRGRIELLPSELRYRYLFRWTAIPYASIRAVKPSPHGSGRVGSGAVQLEMDTLSGGFPRTSKTLAVADEVDFIDELLRRAPHIALERMPSALSFTT